MPSMTTHIATGHDATRVRIAPLAGAIPFALAFVALLAAGPSIAALTLGIVIAFAVQIAFEVRLANAIADGITPDAGLRVAVRIIAAARFAALLYVACLIASAAGEAGFTAVLSLAVFAGFVIAEQGAMILAAALARAPGIAALHLSEGTLGLAAETV